MKRIMRAAIAYPFFLALVLTVPAKADEIALWDGSKVATVVHEDSRPLGLAGQLLARDLKALSGKAPVVSTRLGDCGQVCIVVADHGSPLAKQVARDAGLDLSALNGQWERYDRVAIKSKRNPKITYLLIAGSDTRGAVWGVIDLTREMGVSAWEWWADVTPRRVAQLSVSGDRKLSETPSVQYRGIFLNDEDWGLQPWAAKTYEPEAGDIGPKTYARIFELMWRLKANTIWPAMHDSTKPFYQVKGNAEMADAYAIVMGTSHAEPMMRNNVREWDDKARGDFNFFTNRDQMIRYWDERANEVKGFDNIYSIGLRGKHDSGMEGAKTPEAARDALSEVFGIQRGLLSRAQKKPANQVPQALTLYKEVLDIYKTGLQVPDDVTLVWPEDNYGYINQLSTPAERKRSGGSGIYYHLSYWGRPHDYLWLGTTHPALIREQMDRAYQMDARKIWIANVGDIKPAEYLTQYFLDLAFDHRAIGQTPGQHLTGWAAKTFGQDRADEVAAIMTEFYDLAWERRPEFMGFSQTEPTRPNVISDYIRTGGDEAWRRIDRYRDLTERAEALGETLPQDRQDAYFQLVLYPVRGAASLNERTLKLDLAALYAKQSRANVNLLSNQARAAHARIIADTAAYNARNGGKWAGIMDMAPRRLPVFDEPIYSQWTLPAKPGCTVDASGLAFVSGKPDTRYVTVYSAGQPATWTVSGGVGISFAVEAGQLNLDNGFEQRIKVTYDGASAISGGAIACAGTTLKLNARLLSSGRELVERNGILSLPAAKSVSGDWEIVPGLGSQGGALRARLDLPSSVNNTASQPLIYSFETGSVTDATVEIVAVPAHPLTAANGMKLAVSLDGGPLQVLDFETFGRSEEWKQNVLSNSAVRTLTMPQLPAGKHHLEIYAHDPGFLLDRIDVRPDGAPDYYGAPF